MTRSIVVNEILYITVPLFFRSNRRYFEAFQLVPIMQELLRQHDSDDAFLSLNLRSVLVNLNVQNV